MMMRDGAASVEIAIPSGELLLQSRINFNHSRISARFIEFHQLPYEDAFFDLVYAQGTLAMAIRNFISTQVYRVLTPKGFFCLGETVALSTVTPVFIQDLWKSAEMSVLTRDALLSYYQDRGFVIDTIKNLSGTLTQFYNDSRAVLEERVKSMSAEEKKEYKKLLPRISHEINIYLKQGGNKHIGFIAHLFHK
ncbi:MAG: class I SAM-dependent methyltransferase [Ignavibacteriaceae bacterium]|nr:class I SAM-dependent methyltransferase [Ignavibacteriaceae bacterium]